jgi:DNA-binding MarR family transcriptional regulator
VEDNTTGGFFFPPRAAWSPPSASRCPPRGNAASPRCFVLTNYPPPPTIDRMRASDAHGRRAQAKVTNREVAAVQRSYPKIYLACHTQHQRRRSNDAALTAHESSLLAHLSEEEPMRASELARHLGVGRSTLSAAIKRLTALGYIARAKEPRDARAVALRLSAQGAKAMQGGSVLESSRVKILLTSLKADERARAIEGLTLLAQAATRMPGRRGRAQ